MTRRGCWGLCLRADQQEHQGLTQSLFQACRYGHVQHLEHLLFYGADMSAQNASGNTALHICALYNQVSGMHIPHPNPGAHQALGGGGWPGYLCDPHLLPY